MKHPARRAPTIVLLLAASALSASAVAAPRESTSALIGEQLDKLVKLQLDNTPLPQVLTTIEKQTGVPVGVSDDVYATLPWGTHTPITATVEGLSLRDALAAISGKLGLRFEVRDEGVELSPVPSLRRLGRRATLQELRTLDLLAGHRLAAKPDGWTLATLAASIDASLVAIDQELASQKQQPARLVLELRSTQGVDPTKATVLVARNASLSDALDAIAQQTPLTWYPWGDGIVVLPKHDVTAARLDRTLSLRYDGVDVAQVLADLAKQTGVTFSIEPGAIQRVPPEFRIVRMSVESATVRQALESLQGYTGLGYVVTDDGVYVWNQNRSPAAAGPGRVVATVQVAPNTSALVYEEDLSPEARKALNDARENAAKNLEAQLMRQSTTTQASN